MRHVIPRCWNEQTLSACCFDSELEQVFTTAANKDEADFAARVTTCNLPE